MITYTECNINSDHIKRLSLFWLTILPCLAQRRVTQEVKNILPWHSQASWSTWRSWRRRSSEAGPRKISSCRTRLWSAWVWQCPWRHSSARCRSRTRRGESLRGPGLSRPSGCQTSRSGWTKTTILTLILALQKTQVFKRNYFTKDLNSLAAIQILTNTK